MLLKRKRLPWGTARVGGLLAGLLAVPALAQDPPPSAFTRLEPPGAAETDDAKLRSLEYASTNLDRETILRIVREELEAERARTKVESAPSSDVTWKRYEVGADRELKARWDNGFVAETNDKAFRVHIGGRLEFDNSWFTQDDNILVGSSPDQEMQDGTLFRRARFRTDGRLWELVDFACEVNFANIQDVSNVDNSTVQVGSVGLTDFYVTFREVPWLGNVRMGHVQAPIGLERYSSSNAWYYMERSSMFDAFYNPNDYQNGVVVFDSYLDDRVTLAGSAAWVSKSTVQSFGFGADEGNYGIGARATALPLYYDEGRSFLHVGAGYFHQALVDDRFSVASRPLLRAGAGGGDTPNLIFTGTYFTPNGAGVANAEAALVHGPFSLSSEYSVAHVSDVFEQADFTGPRGDAMYQAAYVEGGLFVTPGDHRRYDQKTGTWTRTNPVQSAFLVKGEDGRSCFGHGAVQLVTRYTYLDLVDGDPLLTPTSGGARAGRQQDVTLGVNWYLNSQTWFMVNYVATRIDSVAPGADGDIHGVGCRLHLDF
jgi:phosphate-selective porin OprO/OprP